MAGTAMPRGTGVSPVTAWRYEAHSLFDSLREPFVLFASSRLISARSHRDGEGEDRRPGAPLRKAQGFLCKLTAHGTAYNSSRRVYGQSLCRKPGRGLYPVRAAP